MFSKTWMSLFLAFSAIPTALSAPSPGSLDLKAVEEISSPPALFPRDISYAMVERDAVADHLDKRAIITSPHQRRTIELVLKQAVHGFAKDTKFTWNIVYHYVSNINGQEGRLVGTREGNSAGAAAFTDFRIDHIFSNGVDGVVTALFDVVTRANQKFEMKLVWEENFTATLGKIEHYLNSYVTYFTSGGAQEHLSQDQFSFRVTGPQD